MIAYYFPPEGNAGSYRPLRFVRQLPYFGWIPAVVSAMPTQYERYDPALLKLVPKEVEVIRVRANDLWQTFQAWRSRQQKDLFNTQQGSFVNLENRYQNGFRTWLREKIRTAEARWYHPDMAMPWIDPAVAATVKWCQRNAIDLIWATAGPISSFLVAEKSSARTGIPYVLDFRDPWSITCTDFEARQSREGTRRYRMAIHHFLKGAKAVVFRYHAEAECFWRAYRGALDASRVYIIPNGYESPMEEFDIAPGDKCIILYAGVLSDYRYDTLLAAVNQLKQADPALAKQLCLQFVCEGAEILADEAAALGVSDIVIAENPRSFVEIARLQRAAHALLVLGRSAVRIGYELMAGAKLFGYLKAARPIVGVLPEDETKKILQHVGARTVADVDSIPDIMKVLRDVVDNWSSGTLSSLVPDARACEAYSSERQTATLVRAFEGLPPDEPFVPKAQAIPPSLREIIEDEKWLDGGSKIQHSKVS
jgi:glycosyltransferase involved in cell wall biosynthesis